MHIKKNRAGGHPRFLLDCIHSLLPVFIFYSFPNPHTIHLGGETAVAELVASG